MKKYYLSVMLLFAAVFAHAQTGNTGIGTITPGSTLQVVGSIAGAYTTVVATTYTVGDNDYYIVYNGTANSIFTLPAGTAAMKGRAYFIKNTTTIYTLTVKPAGTETINGNSSITLNPGELAQIVMQGTSGNGNSTSEVASIGSGNNINNSWTATGNAGTVDWVNFIGTTDNVALNFRVGGEKAGRIGYPPDRNTSFGFQSLNSNIGGVENTASGTSVLSNNTTGNSNTGSGYATLYTNTIGNYNTASGVQSLYYNTTGSYNTTSGFQSLANNTSGVNNAAFGYQSLYSNTLGFQNTGFGNLSLYSNTLGTGNTASGSYALYANTIGIYNTAFGYESLVSNTSGIYNMASGNKSLYSNTSGAGNTASGLQSLYNNTTGDQNTALGVNALYNNSTGHFNTAIGNGADVSTSALTNATAVGNGATVNASNKVRIGNASVTVVELAAAATVSDARFKINISQAYIPGLDFIMKLKPVSYNFDYPGFSAFLHEKNADIPGLTRRSEGRELGFIAQDVERLVKETGVTFNAVHAPENDKDNYSLSYMHFVLPLVKAVQEQQAQIEALKAQNVKLTDQAAEVATLKTAIANMRAELDRVVLEKAGDKSAARK